MEWKVEYLILIPLGWCLLEQIRQSKQNIVSNKTLSSDITILRKDVSVLQKTVDDLAAQLNIFVKTETDILKDLVRDVRVNGK